MNLLFYASNSHFSGKRLWTLHKEVSSELPAEFYTNFHDLRQNLNSFFVDKPSIAVLLAGNRQELSDLVAIKHLFDGIRVILIIPDREKKTVSKGLELYPRFMSYVDGDFTDIAVVLRKMISNINKS